MPIYTRTGDNGITSLFGGKRILKSDIQVATYGSIDELSSFIGLVAFKLKGGDKNLLIGIQKDLHEIMGILAGAKNIKPNFEKKVLFFENKIDEITKTLKPLNNFILPGGTELSSWLHVLRTTCRECERCIVSLNTLHPTPYTLRTIKYLNRLSDLFFTLARKYGKNYIINL